MSKIPASEYMEYNKFIKDAEPCEDAVSREAVINVIHANSVWENEYNLTSSRIKEAVEALPSVTPARKKGQWLRGCPIVVDGGLARQIKCSECGDERIDFFAVSKNYCSNCGAEMER